MDTVAAQTMPVLSLEEQIVRLEALLEAARRVHSSIDPAQVLRGAAATLVRELELEGVVFLAEDAATPLAAYGSPLQAPYAGCSRFALPAKNGATLATLVVKTAQEPGPQSCEQAFDAEFSFIQGLMLQTAVALENALLHERDLQWARLQSDMDAARTIQRSLLPEHMPVVEGYSIAARSDTCYEVGGDYLDVLPLPDGSLLCIVADVAGKGLASALVATSFRSAFRSLAAQGLPLAEMAERVNGLHWSEGAEARRRYVTAILARLDPAAGEIEIVNAGHNPGLLSAPAGVRQIEASGTPLGLLPHVRYQAERFAFPPGARLLLYTDGLTEVFCGEEEFGCERLSALFADKLPENAEAGLEVIWRSLRNFGAGQPQSDDMTALAICHKLAAVEEPTHA